MADRSGSDPKTVLRTIRGPLALTRLGMIAEQVLRAFWPFFTLVMLLLGGLMLGLHDVLPVEVVWAGVVSGALALLVTLGLGARRLHWPSRDEALSRLDGTLKGRPIRALLDDQVIGRDDTASAAVWRAHQARMADRAATARPVSPDLRLSERDPYALRYVAALALVCGLLFGSVWRLNSMSEMTPGAVGLAETASWEGWVEPPRYTGRPTIYLNDVTGPDLNVPQGSRIILRLYGPVGALSVSETVSGRIGEIPPASEQAQDFTIAQDGEIRIDGTGGQSWAVSLLPDTAPEISVAGQATAQAAGEMNLPYTAKDDYGIVAGEAVIELDLAALDRRFGLVTEPEPRETITVPLPLPFSGDRTEFSETFIEDFSKHPWAHLPVRITVSAEDAAGQTGVAEAFTTNLPARRFFDPLAAAIIEQRRDLMWSRENVMRVSQVLRAISYRPDDVFRSETAYLRLRFTLRRLENMAAYGLKPQQQEEIAEALWDLALLLEEGDLGDALERLRRAQERLSQAMKDGASDQEIAELMQELREATEDYMRRLSRQAQQDGQQSPQQNGDQQQQGDAMQMSQNDLQRMMDRIQELMEQGRMAEAQQALEELQQLMENMRVTQGQGSGQNEGQQAMEGLADTLREQQGLSDQAFRDLQEQFNPGARQGESQGNEGRNGGQGRGESHEGQSGEGQGEGEQAGEPGQGSLADRQQALRDQLRQQQGQLPGAGTEAGREAQDALDRAGRAMDGAEDALRQDDYAGAIDQQSEAMEALREGMRSLGEAMAQQNQGQTGQGDQASDLNSQNRDPLGRSTGSQGSLGTDDNLLQGEDAYRRARELLDEIRRRSGDSERPRIELDYLRRLLDRF